MFGRKETEKRSLEDMFKPSEEAVEFDDEVISDDFDENKEVRNESTDEKSSGVPIKPLDCFGMEEAKTEKWLAKCVKFWFCCMSFMWFLFGALTFAPVIFISNKVNVIFKEKKKSLLCAVVIYVAIAVITFLLIF